MIRRPVNRQPVNQRPVTRPDGTPRTEIHPSWGHPHATHQGAGLPNEIRLNQRHPHGNRQDAAHPNEIQPHGTHRDAVPRTLDRNDRPRRVVQRHETNLGRDEENGRTA